MSEYSFLRSPRWVIAVLLVVAFTIVCHLLSQWQLQRRAEARAEIQRVEANFSAVPRQLQVELPTLESFDISQKWLPVTFNGEFLPEEEVLVRNRPCSGASGFDVLTPFRLTDGTVFIVDRGCVPSGSMANTAAPFQPAPTGEVTVVARLRASEPLVTGRGSTDSTVGSINLPSFSERISGPVYTGAYGQIDGVDISRAPYPFQRPTPDEGPHLSYALQWYVFAVIAFGAYGWAARQERRNRESDGAGVSWPAGGPGADADGLTSDATLSTRYGVAGAGGRRTNSRTQGQGARRDADFEDELLDRSRST